MVPVGAISKAILESWIGTVGEGRFLEFKEDIPVHPQRVKELAKDSSDRPRDTWWNGGRVADHGRNEIVEEVVSFANAQGGQLILGMQEEDETPKLAKALAPLPLIQELEARFRDMLLEIVEPRLPQSIVRSLVTKEDGSGVLIIQVEPSRLGPHWVRPTRKATTRRDDKCAVMTMAEIQEMTLRNARQFDEVRGRIDRRLGQVPILLKQLLQEKLPSNYHAGSLDQAVEAWMKKERRNAFAFRVILCAHDDLGLSRLASLTDLVPPPTCVGMIGQVRPPSDLTSFWPIGGERRFLGGVELARESPMGRVVFASERNGDVQASYGFLSNPGEAMSLSRPMLVGALGCAFGIYDNLRMLSTRPEMPVEVGIAISTAGHVHVSNALGGAAEAYGGRLGASAIFPRRTAASHQDYCEILNDTAQDLLDAADSRVENQTRFVYYPRLH